MVAHTFNAGPLLVMVNQNSEFLRNLLKMLMPIGTYGEINLTSTPELALHD